MMHCGKFCKTNKIHHSSSREISAVPLEQPKCSAIATWWDVSTNGKLVLKRNAINDKGHHLVAWSEKIELDAAGTSGE